MVAVSALCLLACRLCVTHILLDTLALPSRIQNKVQAAQNGKWQDDLTILGLFVSPRNR